MRLKNILFKEGNLSGITLNMDPEYAKHIFDDGNTDREMMNSIESLSPAGKTIFDVGAFIASSSLVFAKYVGEKGTVISFEPNPYNLVKMRKNLSLNPELSKIIEVHDIALADEEGKMQMVLSDEVDNGPSSTSRLDYSHSTIRNEDLPSSFKKAEVSVSTLDLFVKKYKAVPDIIKVDIEGAEDKFLLGAKNTIATHKPVLYIEIHSEFCALKCYEILNSLGYALFILREEKDNRVMVKAIPVSKMQKVTIEDKEKIAMKSIEVSIDLMRGLDKMKEEVVRIKDDIIEEHIKKNVLLEDSISSITGELKQKEKEIEQLEIALSGYENSKSWRITKPLRDIISVFKRKE